MKNVNVALIQTIFSALPWPHTEFFLSSFQALGNGRPTIKKFRKTRFLPLAYERIFQPNLLHRARYAGGPNVAEFARPLATASDWSRNSRNLAYFHLFACHRQTAAASVRPATYYVRSVSSTRHSFLVVPEQFSALVSVCARVYSVPRLFSNVLKCFRGQGCRSPDLTNDVVWNSGEFLRFFKLFSEVCIAVLDDRALSPRISPSSIQKIAIFVARELAI